MIVSLSGNKGVGKDVIANILVKDFKYVKISLADPLKHLSAEVFDVPVEDFYDEVKKETKFTHPIILNEKHLGLMLNVIENKWEFPVSEASKEKLLARIGTEFTSPRTILQLLGTEIIRGSIDNEIFLKLADKRIENLADVVIADVRFEEEREWARSKDALMCYINRPKVNTDTHISENNLGNESDYQVVFNNISGLNEFTHDVRMWFHSQPKFRRGF